ncbi:BTAD domain-containing putative transcriptional regulator [Longispora urticae]
MEFRLLGPVEAHAAGGAVPVPAGQGAVVLAALLLADNRAVSVDHLLEAVWGGAPPRHARTALQGHVSRLRRLLDGLDAGRCGVGLHTRPAGYLLTVGPDLVDAHRFERLTATARVRDDEAAIGLLDEALGLWRGPALLGVPLAREAARLDGARLDAVEQLADLLLRAGRASDAAGVLEPWVAGHPLRESLVERGMRALCAGGRQAEAIALFHRTREALCEALGVDPGARLVSVYTEILRGDGRVVAEVPGRAAGVGGGTTGAGAGATEPRAGAGVGAASGRAGTSAQAGVGAVAGAGVGAGAGAGARARAAGPFGGLRLRLDAGLAAFADRDPAQVGAAFDRAEPELARLAAGLLAAGDPAGAWRLVSALGRLYHDRAERPVWAAALRTGLAATRAAGDRPGELAARRQLGVALAGTDPEEAATCFRAALELARELGDPDGERSALTNLAALALGRSAPEQARRWASAAVGLAGKCRAPGGHVLALANLATASAALGAGLEARRHADSALAAAEGSPRLRAVALAARAHVLGADDDRVGAVPAAREIGDRYPARRWAG